MSARHQPSPLPSADLRVSVRLSLSIRHEIDATLFGRVEAARHEPDAVLTSAEGTFGPYGRSARRRFQQGVPPLPLSHLLIFGTLQMCYQVGARAKSGVEQVRLLWRIERAKAVLLKAIVETLPADRKTLQYRRDTPPIRWQRIAGLFPTW